MSSGAIQYGVPTRDFLLCTSLETWAQNPKSDSLICPDKKMKQETQMQNVKVSYHRKYTTEWKWLFTLHSCVISTNRLHKESTTGRNRWLSSDGDQTLLAIFKVMIHLQISIFEDEQRRVFLCIFQIWLAQTHRLLWRCSMWGWRNTITSFKHFTACQSRNSFWCCYTAKEWAMQECLALKCSTVHIIINSFNTVNHFWFWTDDKIFELFFNCMKILYLVIWDSYCVMLQ